MNTSTTPELEKFVDDKVHIGLQQSASEAIRAGLRRLKEDKEHKTRFIVFSMQKLEEKLLAGVRQLDRGEGIPGEVAIARLKERAKARGKNGQILSLGGSRGRSRRNSRDNRV